jgi:hypothetical protein
VLPRVLLRQLRRDRDHVGEEVWVNFDTSWYTGKIVQQSSADGGSINVHFPADDETELFTWREATRDVWLMKHDGFVLEVYTIETDGETLDEISSKKAQDVSLLVALNKRRYKSVKGSSRMQVGSSLLIAQPVAESEEGLRCTNIGKDGWLVRQKQLWRNTRPWQAAFAHKEP